MYWEMALQVKLYVMDEQDVHLPRRNNVLTGYFNHEDERVN